MPKNPSNSPKQTGGKEKKIDAQSPEKKRSAHLIPATIAGVSIAVFGTIAAMTNNNPNETAKKPAVKKTSDDHQSKAPSIIPLSPVVPQQNNSQERVTASQFQAEFIHDGAKIVRVVMTETGGLNRTFVIQKGRVNQMNRLPNGEALPGPQQLEFTYPVFKSEVQGNQRINTRIAEVTIFRVGGKLFRITINNEKGIQQIEVTPGKEEQNHFGIAKDVVEACYGIY